MAATEEFLKNPQLQAFAEKIKSGHSLVTEELWEAPTALLTALAAQASGKHIVILSHSPRLFDDLPYFTGKTPLEFPAWEALPSEEIPPSPDIVGERYRILRAIQEAKEPQLIVTNLHAALQNVLPPKRLEQLHLPLKVGNDVPFDLLPDHLAEMGYHRKAVAADKGEFAVRGGIIDIFPVNSPDPFRIEFFGDEIASIRTYDPLAQTSVKKIDHIVITPGEELELLAEEKELATIFDYLGPNTLLIYDDITTIEEKGLDAKGRFFAPFDLDNQALYIAAEPLHEITTVQGNTFEWFNKKITAEVWRHPFFPLDEENPLEYLNDFTTVRFLYQNDSEKKTLPDGEHEKGYLSSGFTLKEPLLALVPTAALTGRYKVRRQKQRSHYHSHQIETLSLTPGESVVHMNSGIGRYLGIERRANHLGVETEFMLIEYAKGGKLFVPMENANLISKYIGANETPPELHTLGSTKWQRAREKTQAAIVGYANDLLKLQAERVIKGGHAYPTDSDLVEQFGQEFPYHETPDQLLAIQSIGKDLQGATSMDRLVCGDVGYGKTEVAMRAAFKAVVDGGMQVAVLVPTTMLALQHYETFCARMSNFPVRVAQLSRFRKPKEVKKTLEDAASGQVDIVIGTHRIVSKDVQFKKLGLVVIDEEQRFGVRAKEHLKKLRSEVDCLTLSATPIPRTLYMSLVGARDLSVINTPPEDRLPIQSVVCTHSDELIKNALLRELARDGQAYVVHNRVETIYQIADKIRLLVPNAKIVVGHGQMSAAELDSVFHAFKSGQANVLVATSIIENGIDIPRANTILIDRSDRHGLADLYQMRGRVGRWNRKAYCYFMVPNTKELSEMSRKRLSALTQGGNGMKIAMHDLEIRGAGNILGTEQSGHVAAIGFQLYCKLLKKTVAALQKNEKPLLFHEVKIEFPFDARLPDHYVNETSLRMEVYQRLGDAEDNEEVDLIIAEIEDRFGPLPPEVEWLRHLTRLRLFAARSNFTHLKLTKAVFYAEQSHGKKNKISKKMLFKLPKTPAEVEAAMITALRENFPTKP